jgi:hypothetical protein
VADEYGIADCERRADLKDVVGIALECGVARPIEGGGIRPSVAHEIEEYETEVAFQRRGYVAPHVLIASETMGEHYGPGTAADDPYIVTPEVVHTNTFRNAIQTRQFQQPGKRNGPP